MTAPVNALRPATNPISWNTRLKTRPAITPAIPASTPPTKKAIMIVRSTSTPIISAASRSYETARIDRPSFDRPTHNVSITMTATVVTITMIRISDTFSGPTWMPLVNGMKLDAS